MLAVVKVCQFEEIINNLNLLREDNICYFMWMTGFDEFSPLISIIFAFLTIEFSEIEAIDLRIGSSNVKLVSISSKSNRCDCARFLGFAISPWPAKWSEKCNANL